MKQEQHRLVQLNPYVMDRIATYIRNQFCGLLTNTWSSILLTDNNLVITHLKYIIFIDL